MLRLNKLTDYAIVLLTKMALTPEQRFNTPALSAETGIPEPTVAKILKDLCKSCLVQSYRGVQGGYMLGRLREEITVRAVIEAIEGPIAIADCIDGATGCCSAEMRCPVRGNWDKVNAVIIRALDDLTLVDMMRPNAWSPSQNFYEIAFPSEVEGTSRDSSTAFGITK